MGVVRELERAIYAEDWERVRELYEECRQQRRAWLATFGCESGMEVLRQMLLEGHMLDTTFSGDSQMVLREGERNRMLRMLELIPGLFGRALASHCLQEEEHLRRMLERIGEKLAAGDLSPES